MKITGYKLREKIKNLDLKRDNLQAQFHGSLFAFPEELGKKRLPLDLGRELGIVETAIAAHQAAQVEYNLKVKVEVQGVLMTLSQATKMVGGVRRLIESWKHAASQVSNSGHDRVRVRRKDDEMIVAEPQITADAVLAEVEAAEKLAAALNAAIAEGNSVPVDLEAPL